MARRIARVLSIAGSDSGGGAGIQADLKAIAACGAHGMTAVTAITAQSTTGVSAVHPVPPEVIVEQVRQVARDIGVDAVKIGMLGSSETVEAVVEALRHVGGAPVVVDPVMVAESGAVLLDEDARGALRERLVPLATVVTPNLPEARVLAGRGDDAPAEELVRAVHALGPKAVVVTGGHAGAAPEVLDGGERLAAKPGAAIDVFFDGEQVEEIPGERHPDGAAHGSGCTHSSALAAELARGLDPLEAARAARAIAGRAVRDGLRELGRGAGPVDVLGVTFRG